MKPILYLASKSPSRQYLLRESKIPFTVLAQSADETLCDWSLPLRDVVRSIARHKMDSVIMPEGREGQIAFVLTADTLTQDARGTIQGKPANKEAAREMIAALRPYVTVATAFCLKKMILQDGVWVTLAEREEAVVSRCEYDIPEQWLERYFEDSVIGYEAAGGMAVEAYGMQFLRSIEGSYSAVIGLPLYEVRTALEALTFF